MRRLLALPCLLLAVAGAASDYPSPADTRAEFDAICRRFTEGDDQYFGRAIVPELEGRLERGGSDPLAEVLVRGRLAGELIRLGRHADAIEHLETALALAEEHGLAEQGKLRPRILWHLGIAHLQLAEDLNCIERHTATSCILPISEEAVHTLPGEARAAAETFQRYLEESPGEIQATWLLNLARMISGDWPEKVPEPLRLPPDALVSEAEFPRWRQIGTELGVDAFDLSGGGIMDDFDGDGLLDLVSSSWDPCQPLKAFRNDGRGGFEAVGAAWALDSQLGGLNIVHADYDGDGDLDLLVLRGGWLGDDGRIRNSLLRNDLDGEAGRFVDVTAAAGLAYPAYPTQTAGWADMDADGDLDLYIGNEATGSSTNPLQLFGKQGNPYPSQLFRNDGDGTFTDVTRTAGVDNRRYAKGVGWGDYDDDGDPDLYISNIGPNRLYRNEGDGTFTDVAPELGVTEPAVATFPVWWFDHDNDGDLDLFVGSFSAQPARISASYFGRDPGRGGHPVLYRNDGGRFTDVSAEVGLDRPLLVMGANHGDLDNDGWLDLYLGTGVPAFDALMPNVMYRNVAGRRFVDVTFAGGFGHLQKGHGVAFGDIDNDGRQEIFQQLGGAFPYDEYGNTLYEGPPGDARWLVLRLAGGDANPFGVGARVEVVVRRAGEARSIHRLVGSGGSFGGSSLQLEVGLGDAEAVERAVVRWPSGGPPQVVTGLELDRFYRITRGVEGAEPLDPPRIVLGTGLASPPNEHGHGTDGPAHRHGSTTPP